MAFFMSAASFAQNPEVAKDREKSSRHHLLIIKNSMLLQSQINSLAEKPPTPQLRKQMEEIQIQLNKLDLEFEAMVTQLQLHQKDEKDNGQSKWVKELEELTQPILNAIRDLTEKPRAIENLKTKVAVLQKQLEDHENAWINLNELLALESMRDVKASPERKQYLARLEFLQKKYDPELVRLNLEKSRQSLSELLKNKESIVDSTTRMMKDFFRNRGRNLLATAGTFIGLWWILSRLRKWLVNNFVIKRLSPAFAKVFSAGYNAFVVVICFAASLACLYFFNDWLLLSLLAVSLLLAGWTSRHWIPRFLQEIKFVMNLGSVREDERFIWQGIPWRVKKIGLYTTLVNDSLEGGVIRLPVRNLFDQVSRQVVSSEPWFPSVKGDWVMLADTTYGQVQNQSMEQVIIKLKGDALKTYTVENYLAQTPLNISQGFRFSIEFGLDYSVQEKVCDEIPQLFDKGLRKKLQSHFAGEPPDFNFMEVKFDNAGNSSLNLMIVVHVDGRCAELYEELQREIQSALVSLCNENQLVIPFNRLTVDLNHPNAAAIGESTKGS
jgi:small-conductance mechanosensitive channel